MKRTTFIKRQGPRPSIVNRFVIEMPIIAEETESMATSHGSVPSVLMSAIRNSVQEYARIQNSLGSLPVMAEPQITQPHLSTFAIQQTAPMLTSQQQLFNSTSALPTFNNSTYQDPKSVTVQPAINQSLSKITHSYVQSTSNNPSTVMPQQAQPQMVQYPNIHSSTNLSTLNPQSIPSQSHLMTPQVYSTQPGMERFPEQLRALKPKAFNVVRQPNNDNCCSCCFQSAPVHGFSSSW